MINISSDTGNVKCKGVLKHVQNNVTIASNYSKRPSFFARSL